MLFGSGYLANIGVLGALGARRPHDLLRRAQPRLDHRRLPAGARRDLRLPPLRPRPPRLGPARARRARARDRHRLGLLDGRRRRAARARSSSWPRRHGALVVVDEAHATGALGPGGRGAVAEAGLEGEVDVHRRHAQQGARLLRRLRLRARARSSSCCVNTRALADLLDGAAAAGGRRRARRARAADRAAAARREAAGARPTLLRARARRRRHRRRPTGRTQIVPLVVGDADDAVRAVARRCSRAASSRRRSGRRRCPPAARGCA